MNVGQQASPPSPVPTGLAHLAARILASDFPCVGSEVAAAVRAGAERVHVDVMGCHPSEVTAGRLACRALRRVTRAPVEAHLMIPPTRELVAGVAPAGAHALLVPPAAGGGGGAPGGRGGPRGGGGPPPPRRSSKRRSAVTSTTCRACWRRART